jgi:hypothetical protein
MGTETENELSLRDTWAPETRAQPVEYTLADLRAADAAVDEARADLRIAGQNVQRARTELARCLTAWNAGGPVWTPEQNARAFMASELAERKRRAELGLSRRPATVSETARAFAGGGHRVSRGGGRAYARGALSKAQALEANAQRIRAERAAAAITTDEK